MVYFYPTIDPVFLRLEMVAGPVELLHRFGGVRLKIPKQLVRCIHHDYAIFLERS